MRLTRVLALAPLTLFISSCASTPAPQACGSVVGGVEAGAGSAVLGSVLTGTAAYYACSSFSAVDPEDMPPPLPPAPQRSVPAPGARLPEPVGDIPGPPPPPTPLGPEPAAPVAPADAVVPPMPPPPAPVAPPLLPKLPPAIDPVPPPPEPPPPPPEPVPPIEPVPPPPEPPPPPAPEPEPPPPPPPADAVKEKIVLRGVNFDFDRAEIRGDAAVILDEAAEILGRNPDRQVVIEGHTDWTGPEEYNQSLSEGRAEAVKKYMGENGIDETRLSTAGFGESQPIAPNDTRDGRARNRRVEMKVLE